MGIRNGIYAKYKEREYGISTTNIDGSRMIDACRLISGDKIDMEQNGFSLYILPEYITIKGKQYKFEDGGKPTGSYYKTVTPSEVGDIFSIHTYAIYQGQKCSLEGEDDEHYFLRVEQRSIADKLKFEIRDRDDFVKTVLKQDVESVFEEKTLRPNYFK